jgi:DNA-binding MarR family transcriptional regulator
VASDVKAKRGQPATGDSLEMGFLSISLGYHLKRAYLRLHDDFIVVLADLKLRPQLFSALALIVGNPGINQSALARALAIERSNLVVIVDELVQRGLITRNPVSGDRRAHALRATAAGRRCHQTAVERLAVHEERMMAKLTPGERGGLVDVLARIGMVDPADAVRATDSADVE